MGQGRGLVRPDGTRRSRKGRFIRDVRKNWVLWLFLVPAILFFLVNNYLPMVGIYFAFTDFNFRDGLFGSPFVGLKNFEFLFISGALGRLTKNTILYNVAFILLGNLCQVSVAIVISQLTGKWFKKVNQTLILMPYFVSYVILNVFAYNLFHYENGLINNIVVNVFGGQPLDFYTNPSWWPFIITFFSVWKGLGYGTVVYLATITGIGQEYYEAAKVDGATVFQQIRYITLPGVKPTFIILLIYSLGGIVRGQFELFYQLVGNNGLLFSTTDILDTYVYRATISNVDYGIGTAVGLYQSMIGFAIVMATNYVIKKKEPDYALF